MTKCEVCIDEETEQRSGGKLFRFCLDDYIVNIWYLYGDALHSKNKTMPLFEFRRSIVLPILSSQYSSNNVENVMWDCIKILIFVSNMNGDLNN